MNLYWVIGVLILIVMVQAILILLLWRRSRRVDPGLDEIAEDTLKVLFHLSYQ